MHYIEHRMPISAKISDCGGRGRGEGECERVAGKEKMLPASPPGLRCVCDAQDIGVKESLSGGRNGSIIVSGFAPSDML